MTEQAANLFYELADMPPHERENYFIRNSVPADVRAEVESLLRHDGDSIQLTARVAGSAGEMLRASAADGGKCGPYRLIEILGRGGMGAVYLAKRADGEVEQQVAVKLLRHGHGEESFHQRFLRERQILASLSHPGIARLVDAGHTNDGQPYLVMDYIDGVPIDRFAEKLDLRGKLELFVAVCDAVAHAHRNLVIHRDIKPSNILVDSDGQPKLLDFGIAKIIDTAADQTRTRDRLLTPDYASPEQVRGMAQSTATDIYSLGAVLYRLLTGRSPHEFATEAKDDMDVAICSREPVPPSRVNAAIPRDLDFVLLKSLRKEPHERYVSVDAFADDIRAFLEWRPVQARSGNAWYRARKFTRRYWLFVIAASLTIAGLSIGLFAANRERALAQRRFQQVRQLANKLFVLDVDLRDVPNSTKARLALTATSKEYLEGLAAEARGDNALAFEIGVAYLSLARIQGVPTHSNLGMMPDAEESLRRADSFIEPLLEQSPTDRKLIYNSAQIAHDRMILAESSRRGAEALQLGKRAAERYDVLLKKGDLTEKDNDEAARAFSNIAQTHMNLHHYQEAERYADRAIAIGRTLEARNSLVSSLSLKANLLRQMGRLEEALQAISESRNIVDSMPGNGTRMDALLRYTALWREGMILGVDEGISLNRPAEAIHRFQQAFDIVLELNASDPNDTSGRSRAGTAGRELCRVLRHSNPQRAIGVCDQTIRVLREIPNNIKARRDEASVLAASTYSLRRLNRTQESEKRLKTAFEILRQTKDYPAARITPGEETYFTLKAAADHQADLGNTPKAIQIYSELLEKLNAGQPDPLHDLRHATDFSRIYKAFERLQRESGNTAAAAELRRKRVELWQHWDKTLPENSYIKRQLSD